MEKEKKAITFHLFQKFETAELVETICIKHTENYKGVFRSLGQGKC